MGSKHINAYIIIFSLIAVLGFSQTLQAQDSDSISQNPIPSYCESYPIWKRNIDSKQSLYKEFAKSNKNSISICRLFAKISEEYCQIKEYMISLSIQKCQNENVQDEPIECSVADQICGFPEEE